MADKLTGGGSSVEIPKSERFIPRGRQSKLPVRGDDNVLDKVVVATEGLAWDTI